MVTACPYCGTPGDWQGEGTECGACGGVFDVQDVRAPGLRGAARAVRRAACEADAELRARVRAVVTARWPVADGTLAAVPAGMVWAFEADGIPVRRLARGEVEAARRRVVPAAVPEDPEVVRRALVAALTAREELAWTCTSSIVIVRRGGRLLCTVGREATHAVVDFDLALVRDRAVEAAPFVQPVPASEGRPGWRRAVLRGMADANVLLEALV